MTMHTAGITPASVIQMSWRPATLALQSQAAVSEEENTASRLKDAGAAATMIWCRTRLLPSIERQSDGSLIRLQFHDQPGSITAEKRAFVPEQDTHLFAEARIKYSLTH